MGIHSVASKSPLTTLGMSTLTFMKFLISMSMTSSLFYLNSFSTIYNCFYGFSTYLLLSTAVISFFLTASNYLNSPSLTFLYSSMSLWELSLIDFNFLVLNIKKIIRIHLIIIQIKHSSTSLL